MIFKKKEKPVVKTVIIIFLVLIILWYLVPVLLIMSNSFKPSLDIKAIPPKFFFKPTLRHFEKLFSTSDFGTYFKNSIFIALITTFVSLSGGVFGAYGLWLGRNTKWGKKASNLILLGKLVPAITILIPLNMLLFYTGLSGTYVGPILAHSSVNLPFVLWLILGFIRQLPSSLYESAQIEGSSALGILTKIFIPLLLPALGSSFILSMQYSWNELMFSLQLTTITTYTLPVGIARNVGAVAIDWGKGCASATLTMIPIIIIGFAMQKSFVAGMTAGAVKD